MYYDGELLKYYIKEILKKDGKNLSNEEERKLIRKFKNGDKNAGERLIEHNLRLVIKIALQYLNSGVDLLDLIQEGNIGLITAAKKFNYKKGARFITYASYWIKQKIVRYIFRNRHFVKIPLKKAELLLKINMCKEELKNKLHRQPELSEIEKEIKLSSDVIQLLSDNLLFPLSIEDEINQNIFYKLNEYDPCKMAFNNILSESILKIIETLPEREKKVLKYRFGFFDGKKYSLKAVAKIIGYSPETIRQIEKRSLKKLYNTYPELKLYLEEI